MSYRDSYRRAVTMSARTLLVPLLLGAALAACESPTGGPGAAHAIDPASLYGQHCQRCHGADGKGDPGLRQSLPALADLTAPQVRGKPAEELERVVMAGRGQMPPFGGALSPPKIQSVVGYVRRLGNTQGK